MISNCHKYHYVDLADVNIISFQERSLRPLPDVVGDRRDAHLVDALPSVRPGPGGRSQRLLRHGHLPAAGQRRRGRQAVLG